MTRNTLVRLFAILAISAAACSGDDGDTGPAGPAGPQGPEGPAAGTSPKLNLVIDNVATTTGADGALTSTVTFTIFPSTAVCPGGTCDANLASLGQKTFYATEYDPATRTFTTARSFSFIDHAFVATRVDPALGTGAQYTAKRSGASFAPETSQHAMVYGYVADKEVLPRHEARNYRLYDEVSNTAKVYGTIDYTSAATVSGCEKCHGAPYSKHGYRQAHVEGLADFASCKVCHTDQRNGGHLAWQMLVEDPEALLALPLDSRGDPVYTDAQKAKYGYKATVMNDTHMSHAMEFAFPQTMANCVACHEGKLDTVLADANFKIETCKSCHPVNGRATGTDPKRAPALLGTAAHPGVMSAAIHGNMDLATVNCSTCHAAGTFRRLHPGYNQAIYADAAGTKHSASIKTEIGAVTRSGNVLTIPFTVTGAPATAVIKPTVVVSLYGYDTKDFIVSGHGSHADGNRNLEWAEGATRNSARLTVSPAVATAGNTSWTATADLSTWAAMITDARVKRLEIAVLPAVGTLAVAGQTKTYDLTTNAVVADKGVVGKGPNGIGIVDPAKCNNCHGALGTTFHSPSYGSAGVVACRTCHVVGSGGSHLEMQSRSIDSYVHAIHSFQPFDLDTTRFNFADPVEEMEYEHHVESVYPNFSILNCSSCHEAGTYEVPNQAASLPSISSASWTNTTWGRSIGGVTAKVTGPASRACGSCHRAELINEDDAGGLAAFNEHTASFGTYVNSETGVLDSVTANIMNMISGAAIPAGTIAMPAGTKVESCGVCHANAGAQHQAAFDRYADGL